MPGALKERGVPWFTAVQAATYLGFPSVGAFHTWLHRQRKAGTLTLTVHWFRRRMRFRQTDLDRLIEPEAQARRLRLVERA